MPDHLHWIVSGNGPESDLLAMVTVFKQKTAFRVRRMEKPFGWQKDFYDHIIRANEDYGAQVRYLLRNPVRKGLCEHWEQWPHKGVLGQTREQLAVNIAPL
jgi:REP element-mobilizing transposase RayT